ncbi:MAG: amino acid ABC transporter permease [Desulfobacter sp.]|nr:MAG: amino acid ABC transporter permease [Desulfobacter sp.]
MADKNHPINIEVGDGAAIPVKKDKGLVNAWSISFIGAIGCIIYLCMSDPDMYWEVLKFLPDGVLVTFQVTIASIILSLIIGLFTGLGRISENKIINTIASTYVEIVRGIPLLVQLFYIYYALGRFEFLQISELPSAIIAMGICYGAYMGEVFRAGIISIDKGQGEAARSLGFNKTQTMFMVILPQSWKTILPPVGNEFIALLKDSSLVSILAVADILRRGREYASVTFSYFEAYTMVALVYLVITLILSKAVSKMEERLNYYEGY